MNRIRREHISSAHFFSFSALALAASALLAGATAVQASTPEQKCQKGRYDAAAKYTKCEQKIIGKYFGVFSLGLEAQGKCRFKYTETWAKLQAKASGTGSSCDATRFAVSGGIVTDRLTGLQWEQKTADASIHDKENFYTWTALSGGSAADGTVFTTFLASLNSAGCFGGQCDWRLPTRSELLTILSEPYPCTTSPCIDEGTFGPMPIGFYYWSSTTFATDPTTAWLVFFDAGFTSFLFPKSDMTYARAVRGGL